MLLMEPSALKHGIVAGISLDKTYGSTELVSADSELYRFLGLVIPAIYTDGSKPNGWAGIPVV